MSTSGKLWIGKSAGEVIQGENSFDIIRYFLSFAVLVGHFRVITGIPYYFPMSSVDAVHGFFILSGFLVFYSYMRNPDICHYTERRTRRILPPYVFIVTLCWMGGGSIGLYSSCGRIFVLGSVMEIYCGKLFFS